MADYNINKQSSRAGYSPSGVKVSPYYSSPESPTGRGNAINDGNQKRNKSNHSKTTDGYSSNSSDGSKSQLKGGRNDKSDFKDNSDVVVNGNTADGANATTTSENKASKDINSNHSNQKEIRFDGDNSEDSDAQGGSTENYGHRFNERENGEKVKGSGGTSDENRESTPGVQQKTHNSFNKSATSPRKNRAITSSSGSRVNTPRSQSEAPYSSKRKLVGFDNSEKNTNRQSLGSSTDHVAEDRPKFGAWQEPNSERQKRLVERLAPYRPPAPPDPRFNTWVNHFEYYWKIGVDEKQTRKKLEDSLRSNNYKTNYYNQEGEGINGLTTKSATSFNSGYHQSLHRNRLLAGRPHTTSGRVRMRGSGEEENNNSDMDSARRTPRTARMANSSTGDRHPLMTSSGHSRRTQRSRSDGQLLEPVPGLDRRYMGLQSVGEDQLRDIVGRLTRMTSAYHAKFAPNPHVWCDSSPGAHMVIKRENTIA